MQFRWSLPASNSDFRVIFASLRAAGATVETMRDISPLSPTQPIKSAWRLRPSQAVVGRIADRFVLATHRHEARQCLGHLALAQQITRDMRVAVERFGQQPSAQIVVAAAAESRQRRGVGPGR